MEDRKEFCIETQFVFSGKFYVKADNPEQAREYVMKHCGLVLGREIHTTLPDDMVNWDFEVHPETRCKRARRVEEGTISSMNI